MSRVFGALLIGLLGLCGCRFGFDPRTAPVEDDMAPPDDARMLSPPPAVPSAICKVEQYLIEPAPAVADLAVGRTADGYAAIWVDTTGGKPTYGATLDTAHKLLALKQLPEITETRIGGITNTGAGLTLDTQTIDTSTGTPVRVMTMRVLDQDLTQRALQPRLTGYLAGRDAYPSEENLQRRIFVTAINDKIEMATVAADGLVNIAASETFVTTGPVTNLACADGPNHAHCTWSIDVSDAGRTLSRCNATDVFLGPPPSTNGGAPLSDDCFDARTTTGPFLSDSMIVVWRQQNNNIIANYAISAGDVRRTVQSYGLGPKIVFDGKRFWIASLDQTGSLQLTSFDEDTATRGTLTPYTLAGWKPNGTEAFELVHRDAETLLVMVRPDELDVLTLCAAP